MGGATKINRARLLMLISMSVLGLVASLIIVIVFYGAKSPLPFCPPPSSISVASSTLALDCGKVLGSAYGYILGVPLAVFACLYFIANIALVYLVCFGSKKDYNNTFKALLAWRLFGIAMTAYLISIELFKLKAVCAYCTVMHVAIIVDFIILSCFALYRKNMRDFISLKGGAVRA